MTMRLFFSAGPWRRFILASIPVGVAVGCGGRSTSDILRQHDSVPGSSSGNQQLGGSGTAGTAVSDAGRGGGGASAVVPNDPVGGDVNSGDTPVSGLPAHLDPDAEFSDLNCLSPSQLGGNWIVCRDGLLFRTSPGQCEPDLESYVPCSTNEQCDGIQFIGAGGGGQTTCRPTGAAGATGTLPDGGENLWGYCMPYLSCNTDADCDPGEVCLCGYNQGTALLPAPAGTCVNARCNTQDCGDGRVCATDYPGPPQVPCSLDRYLADFVCRDRDHSCGVQEDCDEGLVCGSAIDRTTRCVAPPIVCGTGGRPFFVAGTPQVASLTARSDWQLGDLAIDKSGLSEAQCVFLGQAWAQVAAMEHASIASFARFVLQLMAAGAPASLVEQSQRALGDEVVHARACYGLASAYLGRAVGPDRLPLTGATLDESFEQSVIAAVHEGCVGETLAAIESAELAAHCEEPTTREILCQIAEDEARHAQLAWQFVSWALSNGGTELRSLVQQEFERAADITAQPPAEHSEHSEHDDERLARRGIMGAESRRVLQASALRDVIAPCALRLIGDQKRGPQSFLHASLVV